MILKRFWIVIEEGRNECEKESLNPSFVIVGALVRVVEVGQHQMARVLDNSFVFEIVRQLTSFGWFTEKSLLLPLRFVQRLYLILELLGLILPFVVHFGADALMVQTFPEQLLGLIAPNLVPLPLGVELAIARHPHTTPSLPCLPSTLQPSVSAFPKRLVRQWLDCGTCPQ